VGVSQDKTYCCWQQFGWQRLMLIRIGTHDLKITSHKCSIFLSQHGGSIFLMKDIWIDDKSHIPYIPNPHYSICSWCQSGNTNGIGMGTLSDSMSKALLV
jgi:hypothetical protein